MSQERQEPMPVTERELRHLTADLDELHHATLPAMHHELSEWAESAPGLHARLRALGGVPTSRRRFLIGGGLGLAGLALAGCAGGDEDDEGAKAPASTRPGGGRLSADVQFIAMSASLENVAVGTYQAAIDAVGVGKLANVPPAVVTFAQTAQKQHRDHADAFNAIVTRAGHAKVTAPDPVVKPLVDQAFAQVKSVPDLARLARSLENTAAATYQEGVGTLTDKPSVATLASIQPVERQHAAILSFVLGEYPVPDSFSSTDKKGEEARPASDFQG